VTTNAGQTAAHLGYFEAFMKAWGRATPQTRQEVYDVTLAYRSGTVTADQEVREVSQDLAIPTPPGW
jgi:hypothetical protein